MFFLSAYPCDGRGARRRRGYCAACCQLAVLWEAILAGGGGAVERMKLGDMVVEVATVIPRLAVKKEGYRIPPHARTRAHCSIPHSKGH